MCFELVWSNINKKVFLGLILSSLLLVWVGANFYLWQKKNTPQNVVIVVNSGLELGIDDLQMEKKILSSKQIAEQITFYHSLETNGVQNKAVFLNLSTLELALGEFQQSEGYLNQAKKL